MEVVSFMELKGKVDIYKFCIDMADKTSEYGLKTNAFIITIDTGPISLNSYLSTAGLSQTVWSSVICLVCTIVNLYWAFLASAYRRINETKYKTINRVESGNNLPFKPFNGEYGYLKSRRYLHLTSTERLIPLTLIILDIIIILFIFSLRTKPIPQTIIVNIISERV